MQQDKQLTKKEIDTQIKRLEKQIEELENLEPFKPKVVAPLMRVWGVRDLYNQKLVWFHFECVNWSEVEESRELYKQSVGYYPSGYPKVGCQPYYLDKEDRVIWDGGWVIINFDRPVTDEMLINPTPQVFLSKDFQHPEIWKHIGM